MSVGCSSFSWPLLRWAAAEESKRPDTGKKEVRPTPNRGERGQTLVPFANGAFRNCHIERAVVIADDRVALVVQILELRIVDPDVHRKFKLANQTRAADEGGDAALDAIVRRALRQCRPVCAAPPDHLAALHV